jgi:hypothetical protein
VVVGEGEGAPCNCSPVAKPEHFHMAHSPFQPRRQSAFSLWKEPQLHPMTLSHGRFVCICGLPPSVIGAIILGRRERLKYVWLLPFTALFRLGSGDVQS